MLPHPILEVIMNHKKIAELAYVSPSTVSKALSGSSEISKELADRIYRIAIDCGYFEEKKKRRRKYTNNESMLVAVLVPELLGIHYSETVTRLKNELEAKGAGVAIYVYDFDQAKMNDILRKIVLLGTTDGVIIFDTPELSIEPNIPIVCIKNAIKSKYDSIGNDIDAVISDCVDYLKACGHREIGFVGEPYTLYKYHAFEKALAENELVFNEDFAHIVNTRLEAVGVEAAKRILAAKEKPTAIIAAYDVIALSLIHELTQGGVSVPEDISVMGINNISAAAYAQVPLTTVDLFSEEQYRSAVQILFDKIIDESDAVKHITVEHKIVERASVKNLRR